MTDNDIIKAVGCCEIKDCHECPYRGYTNCRESVMHGALDLINRQNAEIDRWIEQNIRLNKECDHYIDFASTTRTKAIKEFAERLCDGRVSNDPVVIAVKCAVKEMTEVHNAEID